MAKTKAHEAVVKIANADQESLKLSAGDRAAYVDALGLLREFGKPLNLAVAEYVEALRLRPTGTSIKDAVAEFAKRKASVREVVFVPDLVKQFIQAKTKAGMSARHLKDLRFQRNGRQIEWRQNALRHSFGTYKTALSGDIPRTALEMGNSAGMIVRLPAIGHQSAS